MPNTIGKRCKQLFYTYVLMWYFQLLEFSQPNGINIILNKIN